MKLGKGTMLVSFSKLLVVLFVVNQLFEQVKAQNQKAVDFEYVAKNCNTVSNAYGNVGKERTTCIPDENEKYFADKPDACCRVKESADDIPKYGHCRSIGFGKFGGECKVCRKEGEACGDGQCCEATSNSENILKCGTSKPGSNRRTCNKEINSVPFPEKCSSAKFCSDMICSTSEFPQVDCGPNGECLCTIAAKSAKLCSIANQTSRCGKSIPKNYLIDTLLQCNIPATKTKRPRSLCTYIGLDMNKIKSKYDIGHESEAKCQEVCGNKKRDTRLLQDSGPLSAPKYCFCDGFNNKNGCLKALKNSQCANIKGYNDAFSNSEKLVCPIPKSNNNVCVVVRNDKSSCKPSGDPCEKGHDADCCDKCCNQDGKCSSAFLCILDNSVG